MLDVAAAMGMAPEGVRAPETARVSEEDTFDEEKEQQQPRLALPAAEPDLELDLSPFVEEERSKVRRSPREGMGGGEIGRIANAAATTSKLIPVSLGVFVIVATMYVMISLFHSTVQTREEHVELRFLATLNGKPTQVVTQEGAKSARIYIETVPSDLLVIHNREILGKTPLTIDLPIALGDEIGVELSGPYYETWVSQVRREPTSDEYRIHAELTKK